MYSCCVVIVNWNSGRHLEKCLESLARFSNEEVDTIVVVDNASSDGSVDFLDKLIPNNKKLHLINSTQNIGFGSGCNLGVKFLHSLEFGSTHILFLNPDVVILPETFSSLFTSDSVRNNDIGVIGIKLLHDSKASVSTSNFPTAVNFWMKYTGLYSLVRRNWAYHHRKFSNHEKSESVDQVMGAFFLIKSELFKNLKGFDSRYFVYFEEVDLCLRVRGAGYDVWFESSSTAVHYGGGTTERIKGYRQYLSVSSRLRYFHKNNSKIQYIFILLLSFIVEPFVRILRAVLTLSFVNIREILYCYYCFIKYGVK